jgi:hypothetical protein
VRRRSLVEGGVERGLRLDFLRGVGAEVVGRFGVMIEDGSRLGSGLGFGLIEVEGLGVVMLLGIGGEEMEKCRGAGGSLKMLEEGVGVEGS